MHKAASLALFDEEAKHLEGAVLEIRKWRIFSRTYPLLDVGFEDTSRSAFRVQMHCADWNELPPSITLLTSDGTALATLPTGPTGIFHQGPHPITRRPFVCMAGSREYHTHSSHTSDLWDNYRSRAGYDLGGILTRIWNGWLKSRP